MPKPVKRVQEARPKQAVFAASVKQFPKRLVIVTEGDSWFSYPLNANLADYVEMMSDFSMLRLEHNGDEAREILEAGSEQLKKLKYYLKNYPIDLLLLSAGGNDLVAGELGKFLNKKAAGATWQSAVKLNVLTTVLDDIVAAYSRLLDARDAVCPKCVIMAHSYCYFEPTGRKATGPFGLLKAGPWMRPVLSARGIDPDTEGREVARYLVDELHARLKGLAAARPGFHVVDMRAALTVDDVHWADEIHPSGTGFRRLAENFWRPLLKAQFPGRGFD
jgi:lysophospholipase L1-like esterase